MRQFLFSASVLCLAFAVGATPALAKTHHRVVHHHSKHHAKVSHVVSNVRTAQDHLIHLNYLDGNADGKLGPKTRAAIKNFQRDNKLKVDGKLGPKTMRALADADTHFVGSHSFKMKDSDIGVRSVDVSNPDYATSFNGTKKLDSRYGSVDVAESGTGASKRYSVNVNGQPILTIDGQPSVIGISPTYTLNGTAAENNEDVVVFTSYSAADANCAYHTNVLVLANTGSKLIPIENCTRSFQARIDGGSLWISFPEHDDNRAVGATWRVEGMDVNRL